LNGKKHGFALYSYNEDVSSPYERNRDIMDYWEVWNNGTKVWDVLFGNGGW
jgi:hypothetical protein